MDQIPTVTESQATDGDVAMADDAATAEAPSTTVEVKKEVKLDDLFADVDSDDEFPSSRPNEAPPPSSPPTATLPNTT